MSVIDTVGKRLKIPVWMLLPQASDVKLTAQAYLGKEPLINLASLLQHRVAAENLDTLLQTSDDGCKGDEHGAAAIVTPGPNRRGARGRRGGSKNRTDRPDGARSDGGVSNESEEDR